MKKKVKPPVKTSGSKANLASWIIENFPSNYEELTFVEPLCAGASVFLNKNPSTQEVLNDIDRSLICIFKTLRDEPKEFFDRIKRIRITERAFKMAQSKAESGFEDYVDQAVNEFVLRRLSRNGLKKSFYAGTTTWQKTIAELNDIAERVKNCTILNTSAFDVLKVWDEDDTFWYLDPPCLPNAREENLGQTHGHHMTVEDHIQLIALAKNSRGKVLISACSSPLYNRGLKGWKTKKKNVPGSNKDRKLEVLWMNY
jgi:DNA adenine methylase